MSKQINQIAEFRPTELIISEFLDVFDMIKLIDKKNKLYDNVIEIILSFLLDDQEVVLDIYHNDKFHFMIKKYVTPSFIFNHLSNKWNQSMINNETEFGKHMNWKKLILLAPPNTICNAFVRYYKFFICDLKIMNSFFDKLIHYVNSGHSIYVNEYFDLICRITTQQQYDILCNFVLQNENVTEETINEINDYYMELYFKIGKFVRKYRLCDEWLRRDNNSDIFFILTDEEHNHVVELHRRGQVDLFDININNFIEELENMTITDR